MRLAKSLIKHALTRCTVKITCESCCIQLLCRHYEEHRQLHNKSSTFHLMGTFVTDAAKNALDAISHEFFRDNNDLLQNIGIYDEKMGHYITGFQMFVKNLKSDCRTGHPISDETLLNLESNEMVNLLLNTHTNGWKDKDVHSLEKTQSTIESSSTAAAAAEAATTPAATTITAT